MKKLKSAEINLISGGACKTEVTALTAEANAYIDNIPSPRSGTCIIDSEVNVPGFKNSAGATIGSPKAFNMQIGAIKLSCKCSAEYPEDTFELHLFGKPEL